MSPAAQALQDALDADQNAIHTLVVNRVPCNRFLADDKFVQVFGDTQYSVGALGLVNAVLAASGLPLVAAIFSEDDGAVVGFCDYPNNPKQT